MKTYKEIQKTAQIEQDCFCDICGIERRNWERHGSSINIWAEIVKDCGDYDSEQFEYDVCPDCFLTKIIPFIEMFKK